MSCTLGLGAGEGEEAVRRAGEGVRCGAMDEGIRLLFSFGHMVLLRASSHHLLIPSSSFS